MEEANVGGVYTWQYQWFYWCDGIFIEAQNISCMQLLSHDSFTFPSSFRDSSEPELVLLVLQ